MKDLVRKPRDIPMKTTHDNNCKSAMPWAVLVAAVSMIGQAASAADQPPLAAEAVKQFERCLSEDPSRADWRSAPGQASHPRGLVRVDHVVSALVTTATGELHVYGDTGGRQAICGVAVYGADGAQIAAQLTAAIHKLKPGYVLRPQVSYPLKGPPGSTSVYWADPHAPGLYGVTLITSPSGTDAPRLQADYHAILVP